MLLRGNQKITIVFMPHGFTCRGDPCGRPFCVDHDIISALLFRMSILFFRAVAFHGDGVVAVGVAGDHKGRPYFTLPQPES